VSRSYDQNCYFYFDETTREAVVIDPGQNFEGMITFLCANKLSVKAILLTHGHYDHILSAKKFSEYTKAQIYAHEAERELLLDPMINLSGIAGRETISLKITPLADAEEIRVGEDVLTVIHTPGHTQGGVCYYSEAQKLIFTGDTMFWESVGRTDLPTSDGEQLTRSIKEKLLALPADVIVYPGHGRPTDIEHERRIHEEIDFSAFL
jgi:glyoxylase-like metal-dependent hydrolase (beta-lactamase superfamily II)